MRVALAIAALCAIGTGLAAVAHAFPAIVGWLAASTAFALTFAAAFRARTLHAPDDLRERRHPAASDLESLPPDVTRRGVFDRFWGLAFGAVAVLGLVPFFAVARGKRGIAKTAWTPGARLVTPEGFLIRVDDLAVGGVETVFPEGHVGSYESAALLVRLPPVIAAPGQPNDFALAGNVAYSKICTHAGCPVAIYRQASLELYCPCHQSVFDVVHGARPVSGPATRALPHLALDVDRTGYLVARGDFDAPVGPDTWARPT